MKTPFLSEQPSTPTSTSTSKPKPNKYQILFKRLRNIKRSSDSKKKETLIEMDTYSSPLNHKYNLISI